MSHLCALPHKGTADEDSAATGAGASLRGVCPALRLTHTALPCRVASLVRAACHRSGWLPANRRPASSHSRCGSDCLTVCLRQALQSGPLRSAPAGEDEGRGTGERSRLMPKKHITTLYPRDVKALSALARCGYVDREQLGEFLRNKRIEGYCKDGLVERSVYSRPGSREHDREVYRLTAAGRSLCRRELSMSNLYSPQNPAHDLALAGRYFSLSEAERETWRTESQSRDALEEHIHQLRDQGEEARAEQLWEGLRSGSLSMPDAVYTTSEGVTVAFEVITNNYGQAELEAKEEAAEALGASVEFVRA